MIKGIRVKLICLITLFFLAVLSSCKENQSHRNQFNSIDTHQILQKLPNQDVEVLNSFFQQLLRESPFAYTLFGNKPISVVSYRTRNNSQNLYHPNDFLNFEKGWGVWKSYATLFQSKNFILKRVDNNIEGMEIYLINKKHVLKAISDNLDTFERIIGQSIDPQQLLQQLCSEKDVMEALNQSAVLLGILFGFGKENSLLFQRRAEICIYLNNKLTPPLYEYQDMQSLTPISRKFVSLHKNIPSWCCYYDKVPASKGISLGEELNDILKNEEFFDLYGSDYILDRFSFPSFVTSKESAETEGLGQEFLTTRNKIHQAYWKKSFLEVTLNQWTNPQ